MFSRRSFLKTSVALSAAPLVDSWASADSPSEKIALGFVGVGTMGR